MHSEIVTERAWSAEHSRQQRQTPAWPAGAAITVTILILLGPADRALATACAGGAIIVMLATTGARPTSPPAVAIGLLASTLLLGPMIWPLVDQAGGTGVPDIRYDHEVATAAWNAISYMIAGIALGATLAAAGRRTAAGPALTLTEVGRPGQLLATVAVVVTFVAAVSFAGPGLWYRDTYLYLPFASPAALVAGTVSIPLVVMAGWLVAQRRNRAAVTAGWVGIALAALLFFGLGSRRLGLVPILAAFGYHLAGARRRMTPRLMLVVALATLLLWQVSLDERQATHHGVLPYAAALGPETVADMPGAVPTLAANYLVSYPLVGVTAVAAEGRPESHLAISLDPRRGASVGWHEMAPSLRVNVFTPYSAIGELAWYGWTALVAYGVVLGLLLGLGERVLQRLRGLTATVLRLALVAAALLLTVTLLQYNLRAATRLLYLASAIVAVGVAVHALRASRRTQLMGLRS